jgi:2-(1,2-epoxy-1,2-dihydrophenyl)acetyl-CoA isomerase
MTSVDESTVLLSRRASVATVTLNRPHRKNAIDGPTWDALREALREASHDADIRVIVITGAAGAFCAGADLGGDSGPTHPLSRMHDINEVALTLHELDKPTIAKVDGVAVGAGWNLALGCDLVAASTNARFNQIFAQRGLSVDFGGSWLLPRYTGLQQAKRLALLAEFVSAEQARELGLVTWVKPPEELDAFVDAIAAQLAALPPIALAQTKKLLNEGADSTMREALENEARAQAVNFATEDATTAIRAFQNKTRPQFTGKWALG